jgi:thiamine transport system substrate-binding protein
MRQPALLSAVLLSILLAGCTMGAPQPATGTPAGTPASTPAVTGASCMAQVRAALPTVSASVRGQGEVVLLAHDSFTLSQATLDAFTDQTGYTVRVVKMGDAGEALSKALVSKDAPVGDAFFGVDNALLGRAKAADLFEPYASPGISGVDDRFAAPFCAGGRMLATPVDHGYVAFNVDAAWMQAHGVPLPRDLRDLANETYARLTVVENPRTSSPGFAFLLATVDRFGAEGNYTYKDFWRDLRENGARIAPGWEQAYGEDFTQGWSEEGARDRPIVLSYTTSPAFNPMNGGNATSANLDLPKGAWFQVESVGVLRHAKSPAGARALVDFMLSPTFQEDAAASMVVYPVHRDAKAPEAYALHASAPREPATLSPDAIDANRDAWLKGWAQATGQV